MKIKSFLEYQENVDASDLACCFGQENAVEKQKI